ncbi:MAG: class I SAM-dependent methyltransferase [Alphaproteobacteria bacterium]|nr:class I SAM-dependent methyltransferase [Alphaproteobacteria bacterium]
MTGDETASAYDRWAAVYETDRNRTRDLDGAVLRGAGLPLAGAVVVEIGCGTGRNTEFLAAHAARVLALDFSEGMLAKAQARCAGRPVRFVAQDIRTRWPAEDASIDVAVTDLVLEHIEDLAPIFAEAARVLRPGGVFHVSELHPAMQRDGKQANFTDPATGAEVRVPAFRHTIPEFVNTAIAAGLVLRRLDEWFIDEVDRTAGRPRLLTLLLERHR